MNGENERVLYPSVAPLEPKTVMYVKFTPFQTVEVQWANLNHRDFSGTAEVITEIHSQWRTNIKSFDVNLINKMNGIDIHFQRYNDTTWSCDEAMANLSPEYTIFIRESGGAVSEFRGPPGRQMLRASPVYAADPPACFGGRPMTPKDRAKLTEINCAADQCFLSTSGTSEAPEAYCDNVFTTPSVISPYCYDPIPEMAFRTENLGFWNVHFYPEAWYYCRDPSTGKPLSEAEGCPRMDIRTAHAKKKESLDNPSDLNLKPYRNPALSDSASSILSIQFVEDNGLPLVQRDYIWLSALKVGSKIPFEHFPNRMFRVRNTSQAALMDALLQSYTESDREAQDMLNLSARCGAAWQETDLQVGRLLYPIPGRANGKYTPAANLNQAHFKYHGCPDLPHPELGNLTKTQARAFIWQTPPQCSSNQMHKALSFYTQAAALLNAPEDQKQIAKVTLIVQDLLTRRRGIQNADPTLEDRVCPATWVSKL